MKLAAIGLMAVVVGNAMFPVIARAAEPDEFFKDKQINLFIGYAPGGGYDEYGRLAARFLGEHIPGKPRVVVQYKPGAGGAVLANDLFNTAPKDGTVLAMYSNSIHLWEILGQDNLRFKSSKFNWIGRMTDADDVMAARPASGVTKFADALTKQISIGVPGANSSPAMMVGAINYILHTKFKIVNGYTGSSEIRLAVERGEIDGNQSLLWSVDHDWVERNGFNVIYRVSNSSNTPLTKVPSLLSLAKDPDDIALMRFFTSYTDVGRAITAPPGLPEERLKMLRDAFMAMIKSPAFIEETKRLNTRIDPMSGEALQAVVRSADELPEALKKRAREAVGLKQ